MGSSRLLELGWEPVWKSLHDYVRGLANIPDFSEHEKRFKQSERIALAYAMEYGGFIDSRVARPLPPIPESSSSGSSFPMQTFDLGTDDDDDDDDDEDDGEGIGWAYFDDDEEESMEDVGLSYLDDHEIGRFLRECIAIERPLTQSESKKFERVDKTIKQKLQEINDSIGHLTGIVKNRHLNTLWANLAAVQQQGEAREESKKARDAVDAMIKSILRKGTKKLVPKVVVTKKGDVKVPRKRIAKQIISLVKNIKKQKTYKAKYSILRQGFAEIKKVLKRKENERAEWLVRQKRAKRIRRRIAGEPARDASPLPSP